MRVTVNGDARELSDGVTVEQLVRELGLGARRIAVEINLDVVPRAELAGRDASELRSGMRVGHGHQSGTGIVGMRRRAWAGSNGHW